MIQSMVKICSLFLINSCRAFFNFKSLSCNFSLPIYTPRKSQLVCLSHPSCSVIQARNSHKMSSPK